MVDLKRESVDNMERENGGNLGPAGCGYWIFHVGVGPGDL